MKLSIISYENKVSDKLFEELSKIEFGLKVLKYGDFKTSDMALSTIKLKRKILSAISESVNDEVDYIVLQVNEEVGDFDFISEFSKAGIYRVSFDKQITEQELTKRIDDLRKNISDAIDHRLFQMYEMEGCGCSACRSGVDK